MIPATKLGGIDQIALPIKIDLSTDDIIGDGVFGRELGMVPPQGGENPIFKCLVKWSAFHPGDNIAQ